MGVKNWKQRAQEGKQWKEIIEQAKTQSCRAEEEEEANFVMTKCLLKNVGRVA
jgi:hypothetical protein